MKRSEKSEYKQLLNEDLVLTGIKEPLLLNNEEGQSLNNSIPIISRAIIPDPIINSSPSNSSGYFKYSLQHDEESQLLSSEIGSSIDTPRPRRINSRSLISLDLKSVTETVSKWTNSITKWTSSSKTVSIPNEIQYSVFKPHPYIKPIQYIPEEGFINNDLISQQMFHEIVQDSIVAITELGKNPKRITSGSSGSYYIMNKEGVIVGIFKPKDEEPYGPLSPKWTKWLHRNLFPCFFGRSCLIPNLGYICESAASLLDRQLQTYIVPFTDVVSLSSDCFYYSYWDRKSKTILPSKVGSYQLFLKDYICADKFFEKYPLPNSKWIISRESFCFTFNENILINQNDQFIFKWTLEVLKQFREELEKLVILDYIMRNTDRGLDNWMIHIEWNTKLNGIKYPFLKIGAIDSGLSFPWKHPDEWRSYPFGWLFLPSSIIGQPFSVKTRNHFLPLLTSTLWWEETAILFRNLFSKDADFKERMWRKQWAVLKGQAYNVVEVLKNSEHGPLDLARRSRVLVHDEEMEVSVHIPISMMETTMKTPIHRITGKNSAKSNLESIIEGETTNCKTFKDEEFKKNKLDSSSNKIKDSELQSPKIRHFNSNEDIINDLDIPPATKRVIIERLQPVTSKPPVFTWC